MSIKALLAMACLSLSLVACASAPPKDNSARDQQTIDAAKKADQELGR